jgi:hypothetical protein
MSVDMKRDNPEVRFRLDLELREQLEAEAKKNNRSLSAEVNARLQQSLSDAGRNADADREEMLRSTIAAKDAELSALRNGAAFMIANIEELCRRLLDAVYEDVKEGDETDKPLIENMLEREVSSFLQHFGVSDRMRGKVGVLFGGDRKKLIPETWEERRAKRKKD